MGRVERKVAFITGAARGQGRSHAVRLAQEGADIIAVDNCADVASVTPFYAGATEEDLAETKRQVEALGRRVFTAKADVRDIDALQQAVDDGVAELGRLDIVVANAGIFTFGTETHKVDEQSWQDLMDINITGVWHTTKVATPHLRATGAGGSVILISSLAGFKGLANVAAYTTTKHGIVGLMKVLANELGAHGIRVNNIHPNAIDTDMVKNEATYKLFRPDLEKPTLEDAEPSFAGLNPFGIGFIDPVDVSNAVLFLASDEARYVSGAQLPVDAAAAVQ
ncbi:mycofactocin-coupled SDR family oxidoreductase [Spiractinospora alimapuensis]|uniref:mycofactocin-coupled SDR family oxidoreductase n=1 Tax=Spiractinospora alimapuensis TaxID=2820884 RepID=UPI001F1E92DC|nr:mycofactocin-coupled SDR family oxidoreductase [Spiractinospora alimapuensis]QVQ52803.1 mycofactocin-coupled SDR family oxidoreductase [Spiractinospora alimapuensis]